MGRIGSVSESLRHEGRRCESQDVDGGAVAGGRSECGWNGRGDGGCGSDWLGRVAEVDVLRERGFEVLQRFGRAFRDQRAEIEETATQTVAEVRAENRGRPERLHALE